VATGRATLGHDSVDAGRNGLKRYIHITRLNPDGSARGMKLRHPCSDRNVEVEHDDRNLGTGGDIDMVLRGERPHRRLREYESTPNTPVVRAVIAAMRAATTGGGSGPTP